MAAMRAAVWGATAVLIAGVPTVTLPVGDLLPPAAADSPACTGTSCSFVSPSRAIGCVINVQSTDGTPDSAFCAWSDEDRAQSVRLLANGTLEEFCSHVI